MFAIGMIPPRPGTVFDNTSLMYIVNSRFSHSHSYKVGGGGKSQQNDACLSVLLQGVWHTGVGGFLVLCLLLLLLLLQGEE